MPYARRDSQGNIIELRGSATGQVREKVTADDPAVLAFISDDRTGTRLETLLSATDYQLGRVIEDLIAVLVDKGVIMFSDLPHAAQRKLAQRREAREGLRSEPPFMLTKDKIL